MRQGGGYLGVSGAINGRTLMSYDRLDATKKVGMGAARGGSGRDDKRGDGQ